MRYLRNTCTNAHYNMAFDQFCLEQLPLDEPVFYLWQNAPSVIIGQNQNAYTEVNLPYLEEHGILLARRMTGGGAVYHDLQNLNYTIVGRSSDLEHDYPNYLTLMIEALKQLAVPATLSGRNDILVEGKKVSGYAKRGWRDRLMIHGTLMYDVDLETLSKVLSVQAEKMEIHGISSVKSRVTNLKEYLPSFTSVQALQKSLEEILSRRYSDPEIVLTDGQLRCIDEMTSSKFSRWEWNYGRSPQASIHRKKRFGCGTVEVHLSIEKGVISELEFTGDFIGSRTVSQLPAKFIGVRPERRELEKALQNEDIGGYFDHLSPGELIGLILGT